MSLLSRLLLTIVTLTSCVTISFAQGQAPIGKDLTVTVKVTDKTGAMPGASVLVKGTTNGQITGPDGTATLLQCTCGRDTGRIFRRVSGR